MSKHVNDRKNGFGVLTKYVKERGMSVTDFNDTVGINDKTAGNWKRNGYKQNTLVSNNIYKKIFDVKNSFERFQEYLAKNSYVFPWEDYEDEIRAFHEFLCADISELTNKAISIPSFNLDSKCWCTTLKDTRFVNLKVDSRLLSKLLPIVPENKKNQPAAEAETETAKSMDLWDIITKESEKLIFIHGEGGMGKTTSLYNILRLAYKEKKLPESIVPFYIDLSDAPADDPDQIIYTEKRESSFIQRSLCKICCDDKENIAFTAPFNDVKNVLDSLFSTPDKKIVLLCDGLNEISNVLNAAYYSPASMIQEELLDILNAYSESNIQIIVTGRVLEDAKVLTANAAKCYRLHGLDQNVIFDYLKDLKSEYDAREETVKSHALDEKIKRVESDQKLCEVLTAPFFLIMYAELDQYDVSSRDEILSKYYNSTRFTLRHKQRKNAYIGLTEQDKIISRNPLTKDMLTWILDIVLPEIAKTIDGRFNITEEEIKKYIIVPFITGATGNDGKWFYAENDFNNKFVQGAFPNYQLGDVSIQTTLQNMREQYGIDNLCTAILRHCVSTFGILTEEQMMYRQKQYQFVHQYVRDYFYARRITNNLHVSAVAYSGYPENQENAYKCLTVLEAKPLPRPIITMIAEILGEHKNTPYFDKKWIYPLGDQEIPLTDDRRLIEYMLKICCGYDDTGYIMWNLIEILKIRGDLSGADLSGLDLRKCSLNGVHLSRNRLAAKFDRTTIFPSTLYPLNHRDKINDVCFDADGSHIITASADRTIKVWNMQTLCCKKTLTELTNEVRSVCYCTAKKWLISLSIDGYIQIWDHNYLLHKKINSETRTPVASIAVSDSGNRIAVYYSNLITSENILRIWNTDTWESQEVLKRDLQQEDTQTFIKLRYMSFSKDGKYLIADIGNLYRTVGGNIFVFNAECPQNEPIITYPKNVPVVFCKESTYVIVKKDDLHHQVVDIFSPNKVLGEFTTDKSIVSATYSDATKILSLNCEDDLITVSMKTFKQLNSTSKLRLPTIAYDPLSCNGLTVCRNGHVAAFLYDSDKGVCLYDISKDIIIGQITMQSYSIRKMEFSRDSKALLIELGAGEIEIFSRAENDKMIRQSVTDISEPLNQFISTSHPGDWYENNIYSPDDGFVNEFKKSHNISSELREELDNASEIMFSPDKEYISIKNGDVSVWNAETSEKTKIPITSPGRWDMLGITDHGVAAIIFEYPRKIECWNTKNSSEVTECCNFEIHSEDYIFNLAFSPDGELLVTAGWKEINIWRVADQSNKPIQTIPILPGMFMQKIKFDIDCKKCGFKVDDIEVFCTYGASINDIYDR